MFILRVILEFTCLVFLIVNNKKNFVDKSSQLGFLLCSIFQCLVFIYGSKILPVCVCPGLIQTLAYFSSEL